MRSSLSRHSIASVLALSIASLAAGSAAAAATAADQPAADAAAPDGQGSTGEIIVTANKRAENVLKVPASIAVVTASELATRNIQGIQDLEKSVPGFLFRGSDNAADASLTVRGISTNSFSRSVEPSVGTVIDGVVLGLQGPNLFNFDDVARVEVLRGPQGTLFGMNSSAGTLNIVTKDPTNHLSADLGASYGSYDEIRVHGSVSGPLTDKLLLRVSGFYDRRGAYVHNLYTGEALNDDRQGGGRFKLLFKPGETTKITLTGDAEWDKGNCCAAVFVKFIPGRSDAFDQQFYGPINGTKNMTDLPGTAYSRAHGKGVALQIDQELGGGYTFTSITGYRTYYLDSNVTIVFPSLTSPINETISTQHQVSEEARIASPLGGLVDYVVGAFYFDQHKGGSINQIGVLTGLGFGQQIHVSYDKADNTNYALFGEANIHPTSNLTLVGGARWTDEKVSFQNTGLAHDPTYFLGNLAPGVSIQDQTSMHKWSWRFGAKWQAARQAMVYATVSRGIKGPAFNTSAIPSTGTERVDPEIATNYEIGFKGAFLDNRVRTTLTVFTTDFKAFQAQAPQLDPLTGIYAFRLLNAGKLRSKGFEASLDVAATKTLDLSGDVSYVDAKFRQFTAQCYTGQTLAQGCVGGVQDLAGARLPNSPNWSWNVAADDRIPLASLPFDGFVHVGFSWRGSVEWDPYQDPYAIEGPHGSLDASIGIRSHNGRYTVSIFGKNLTSNYYTVGRSATTEVTGYLPPDYKRVLGAKVELSF